MCGVCVEGVVWVGVHACVCVCVCVHACVRACVCVFYTEQGAGWLLVVEL